MATVTEMGSPQDHERMFRFFSLFLDFSDDIMKHFPFSPPNHPYF
jgi:hypothetical protein